jgi:hypothetical protein
MSPEDKIIRKAKRKGRLPFHFESESMPITPGKGTTRCNRTACQTQLTMGRRWWNRITEAFYCDTCAKRINAGSDMGPLCALERTDVKTVIGETYDGPPMICRPVKQ